MSTNTPTHTVLCGRDYETADGEAKTSWTRIGAGWPTSDGKGISIVLDLLPRDGRILVRERDEEESEETDISSS